MACKGPSVQSRSAPLICPGRFGAGGMGLIPHGRMNGSILELSFLRNQRNLLPTGAVLTARRSSQTERRLASFGIWRKQCVLVPASTWRMPLSRHILGNLIPLLVFPRSAVISIHPSLATRSPHSLSGTEYLPVNSGRYAISTSGARIVAAAVKAFTTLIAIFSSNISLIVTQRPARRGNRRT